MSEYPKKLSNNSWVVQVKEDGKTKELYLQFPDGAIDQVGWDIGDTIVWEELPDSGGYKLSKKPVEHGGPKGEEPTRYGTWENKGRDFDF